MNKKEELSEKITKLNKAWKMIRKSIALIKEVFGKNTDVDYYIWKLAKSNDKLQSFIYKKIENDHIEEEYQKLIKKLKE